MYLSLAGRPKSFIAAPSVLELMLNCVVSSTKRLIRPKNVRVAHQTLRRAVQSNDRSMRPLKSPQLFPSRWYHRTSLVAENNTPTQSLNTSVQQTGEEQVCKL